MTQVRVSAAQATERIDRLRNGMRSELRQTMRRFAFAPVAGNGAALIVFLGLYAAPDWSATSKSLLALSSFILVAGLLAGALSYLIEPHFARRTVADLDDMYNAAIRDVLLTFPFETEVDEQRAGTLFARIREFELLFEEQINTKLAQTTIWMYRLGCLSASLFMLAVGLVAITILHRDLWPLILAFLCNIQGS